MIRVVETVNASLLLMDSNVANVKMDIMDFLNAKVPISGWKMNRVLKIMRNFISHLYCYWFSACECNEDGSHDITCDDDTGVCNCRDNITNDKCDQCTSGFFGFPTCEGK